MALVFVGKGVKAGGLWAWGRDTQLLRFISAIFIVDEMLLYILQDDTTLMSFIVFCHAFASELILGQFFFLFPVIFPSPFILGNTVIYLWSL